MKRLKRKLCTQDFADAPNILYNEDDGCVCHVLNNDISKSLGEEKVVGHCHATDLAMSVHQRRTQLWSALFRIVDTDLEVFEMEPPAENVQHVARVIDATIVRTQQVVRSQAGDEEERTRGNIL